MVHGDDSGLVLPPRIAPIQAVIIPVAMHKPGIIEKAKEILAEFEKAGIRVKLDDSDNSPGWKYSEYEMKGVPLRIEIGPRDIENGVAVVARRDNGEKSTLSLDNLASSVSELLDDIMTGLYNKAKERKDRMTYIAHTADELKEITSQKNGFIKMMWCGDEACEKAVKDTYGVGSRCIPLEQEHIGDVCPICGRPAKHMVVWGKAY